MSQMNIGQCAGLRQKNDSLSLAKKSYGLHAELRRNG